MSTLTKQEIFDRVLNGIRGQNYRQSQNEVEEVCLYISSNGDRCAVGHLLPEDIIERIKVIGLDANRSRIPVLMSRYFPELRRLFSPKDMLFLRALQAIHDCIHEKAAQLEVAHREIFEHDMSYLAKTHNLIYRKPT